MINSNILKAYEVLEGKKISKELALDLISLKGEDVLDLLSLANKVKNRFANEKHVCSIMNCKSGICAENCKYCAQSSHHHANIDVYQLKSEQEILKEAQTVWESGVKHFGIVTSGTGFLKVEDEDFQKILKSIYLIHQELPQMNICACLGHLSEETAFELAKANVVHYNINLQTNPLKYKELVSDTHSIEDRVSTIKNLKKNNIKVCSGGIFGLGESLSDRVELAFALKELDVDVIPLNVLIPIEGTPLEKQTPISVIEAVKTFAVFRLVNPSKTLKFAAGRETIMKDFQGLLMLSGLNGMLSGGYLTTRGRTVAEDKLFLEELEAFNV